MGDENQNIKENQEEKNKLDHLLDSTYPLLQKFRRACPGTYKHCQTLASIIEAVAMELDLDIAEMKIRAMYHDIGKMINPEYFSENQGDNNAHDNIDPNLSVNIITRHIADTVLILIQDGNFPVDIIDSISRHHGNNCLEVFFQKSENERRSKYRYHSARPQNVKDAILMITDVAEASTRSLSQGGKLDDVEKHVEKIIQKLLNDGQLNDVTMKLGDLGRIKTILISELSGLHQKRVEYKDEDKE